MCGLLAIAGEIPAGTEAALEALRPRGPEGRGEWSQPDLFLGHTLLSLSTDVPVPQPLVDDELGLAAVVNGEFYDHDEIRRELQGQGCRFRTGLDSEILLHLYARRGLDGFSALRGEFAFVLCDLRQNRLYAVRDRFGIKPLYWRRDATSLIFSSEVKAIRALGFPLAWDSLSLFQAASRQYHDLDRSLFAGISMVRPGHFLDVDLRQRSITERRYWELPLRQAQNRSDDEATGLLRQELEEAVTLRLRSPHAAAIHLSGGLDSTTIACLAARQRSDLRLFTVSYPGSAYDELDLARATAESLGLPLQEVRVDAAAIAAHLAAAVVGSEGLGINGHHSAKFLLNASIRAAGHKLALSGEGADELFAGYPFLIPGRDDAAVRGIMHATGAGLPLDTVRRELPSLPAFFPAKAALGLAHQALLKPEFLAQFSRLDPFLQILQQPGFADAAKGRSELDLSLFHWIKSALPQYILRTLGDGCEMPHGIEGRVPFLDHHLCAFAATLREDQLIRDGEEKFLLRQALRGLIPEAVRHRRKHPFMAPPVIAQTPLLALLRDGLERCPDHYCSRRLEALIAALPSLPETELKRWEPPLFLFLSSVALEQGMMR